MGESTDMWGLTLNTMVHNWLGYLRNVRHFSEATVESYRRDILSWYSFLSEKGLSENSVNLRDARSFVTFMTVSGMAVATVNRHLSSLKNYYNWKHRQDPSIINPFSGIRGLRNARKLPGYLSFEEFQKLLSCIEHENADKDDFFGKRDRLLLEILYSTGCRISEICALNIANVQRRQVKVRGKGKKERIVFIGTEAARALKEYVPLRSKKLADSLKNSQALILNSRGHRLTTRGAQYIIHKYVVRSGISKVVTPHTLRHSFATHVHNEGANIRTVQALLGHSSLSTTQIYTHTGIERIRDIYRKSHPHGRNINQSRGSHD